MIRKLHKNILVRELPSRRTGLPFRTGLCGGLTIKKPTRRQFLQWASASAISAPFLEGLVLEPNRIDSQRIAIPIDDLPPEFEGYRISLFSDIHYPIGSDAEFIHRAVRLANEFKPDLIAIPGDFFHRRQGGVVFRLDGLFDDLKAPDGILGTLGNHDHSYGCNEVSLVIEEDTPIKLIDNSNIILKRGTGSLAIAGVADLWSLQVNMDKAMEGIPSHVPRILLSHNPDVAEYYDGNHHRVDLQLSGHTHGGQCIIPGIIDPTTKVSRYGSKFNRGLIQGSRHRVFVTKGLARLHGVRFLAPPDVTGITLTRAT